MSDIFREVEEDVRRERFEQLWKKYGDYVLAGAAILVIAVAAFQLWRYYENRERVRASQAYTAAQEVAAAGAPEKAAEDFGRLADTAPGGYASLARLQHADMLLATGKSGEAIALYKQIAGGDDDILAGIARIRAGWAMVESVPKPELENLLAPLTSETSGWRALAREILAYSDYRAGKTNAAMLEFRNIAKDKEAPAAVRTRATVMAQFIAAGGENNYGHVPVPAAVNPAATAPDNKAQSQGSTPK